MRYLLALIYFSNSGSQWCMPLGKECIESCDYFIPNETELKRLLLSFIPDYFDNDRNKDNDDNNLKSAIKSAKVLQEHAKVKNTIVTLGSKGCIYLNSKTKHCLFAP